jgi:plasmid maintenance system antidote protein VapI
MFDPGKISTRRAAEAGRRSRATDNREDVDSGELVRGNLSRLCVERGLSIEKLAELSGVPLSTLQDLLAGDRFPSIGLLWKLARALDLPCTAFIEEPEIGAMPTPQAGAA